MYISTYKYIYSNIIINTSKYIIIYISMHIHIDRYVSVGKYIYKLYM